MSQQVELILPILIAVFVLVIAGTVFLLVKNQLRKGKRFYKAKGPYLLSPGEKSFFDALSKSIYTGLYVCPKVRIADLVEVELPKEDKDFWPKFNKISQKHVDFVICNRLDFAPRLMLS